MSTSDYLEKDYYAALGVTKDADADAIKKAYRRLARQHHPDANKNDPDAEERFKEISEAYDVLSDTTKRSEYDEIRAYGGAAFGGPGGFGAGPGAGFPPGAEGFANVNLGDLFGDGGGGLGDVLGGIFGGGGRGPRSRRPRKGADLEAEVTVAFRDAVDGVVVPLRLTGDGPCATCGGTGARPGTAPHVCPVCGGSGQTVQQQGGFGFAEPCRACHGRGAVVDDPCPTCHGTGVGSATRTVSVRLPAGVKDQARIRVKGKGAGGSGGGPAGDLYVTVRVRKHPLFGRRGDNVTVTVPVRFDEAALGSKVGVPTLAGDTVTVKIPAGTPSGRTFRVKGRGISRPNGDRGDLLVTVDVAVPQHLAGAAKDAVEAYRAASEAHDPRAGLAELATKE
jgi:molecular chaperone DnaJ